MRVYIYTRTCTNVWFRSQKVAGQNSGRRETTDSKNVLTEGTGLRVEDQPAL